MTVIARDSSAADHLVYAWPLPIGPECEVACSEEEQVVMCPAWMVGDRLGPGRHRWRTPDPTRPVSAFFVLTAPVDISFDMVTGFIVPQNGQPVRLRATGSLQVRCADPGLLIAQFVGLPFDTVNDGIVRSVRRSVERMLARLLTRRVVMAGTAAAVTNSSTLQQIVEELVAYNPTAGAVFGVELIRMGFVAIGADDGSAPTLEIGAASNGTNGHASSPHIREKLTDRAPAQLPPQAVTQAEPAPPGSPNKFKRPPTPRLDQQPGLSPSQLAAQSSAAQSSSTPKSPFAMTAQDGLANKRSEPAVKDATVRGVSPFAAKTADEEPAPPASKRAASSPPVDVRSSSQGSQASGEIGAKRAPSHSEGSRSGDARPGEIRSGEIRSGEIRSGEILSGEIRSGEIRSGEIRSRENRSGDIRSGGASSDDSRSGEIRSGHIRSGEASSGDSRSGEIRSGDIRSGDIRSGEIGSGDLRSSDSRSGGASSGDSRSAGASSGDSRSGEVRSGDGRSGEIRSGDIRSGEVRSGASRPSDIRAGGDVRSGDAPSGESRSGESRSGEGRSGEGRSGQVGAKRATIASAAVPPPGPAPRRATPMIVPSTDEELTEPTPRTPTPPAGTAAVIPQRPSSPTLRGATPLAAEAAAALAASNARAGGGNLASPTKAPEPPRAVLGIGMGAIGVEPAKAAEPSKVPVGGRVLVPGPNGLMQSATVRQLLQGYYEIEIGSTGQTVWVPVAGVVPD